MQRFYCVLALTILLTVAVPAAADTEVIAAQGVLRLPHALAGLEVLIEKVVGADGRIELRSNSPQLQSFDDLDRLLDDERQLEHKKWGNLGNELRLRFTEMADRESVKVVIYLRMPRVTYLDKYHHSAAELIAHSQALTRVRPVVSSQEVARVYGLAVEEVAEAGENRIVATVSKTALSLLRFDETIAAVELWREEEPTYPLTTFTHSSYNSPPLPVGARGGGVNVSTFETGVYQENFDCMGNLDPANIDITATHNGNNDHSNLTFKTLWNTAPDGTFFHHDSANFSSSGSQNFLVNNDIRTSSISYTRWGSNQNTYEMRLMDDFAYRWPFPVFTNPTANGGYSLEAHWQCYNCISIGNVRHTNERYYELADCTQTRNPDPVYGPAISGSAGDWEMPQLVVPGIHPDPNDAQAVDECLGAFNLWCGTSISAPVANGVAGAVISSDSRMENNPEMVKAVLLLTAQNVEAGYWASAVDERDGTGVISGADAIAFARNHTTVRPGAQAIDGLGGGSLATSNEGDTLTFYIRTPPDKPGSRHLRAAVVWTSNPDMVANVNSLSDLDLELRDSLGNLIAGSYSLDGNVEIIDIPADGLSANTLYTLEVEVVDMRIPADARANYLYYTVGWTWAEDFFWQTPKRSWELGIYNPYYCSSSTTLDATARRFCQELGHEDFVRYTQDGPRSGVHTWWTGSSWTTSGNGSVCYISDLLCEPKRPYFQTPTPVYQIGIPSSNCASSSTYSSLATSAGHFCQDNGFDTYQSFEVDGPRGGVHSWWNGSSWSTSGNNNVCYVEDLLCRSFEICGDSFDNDGDGFIDENC